MIVADGALELWTLQRVLAAARSTLDGVERFGIELTAQSRLARAYRVIRGLRPGDVVDGLVVAEAVRTIVEQFYIVRAIDRQDAQAIAKLSIIQTGADTALDDAKSLSRNTQVEMLAAALLRLADIPGVRMDEPDIRISLGGKSIGVAVKRLASKKQLTKRIRRAIAQIRGSADVGVIVLSFDECVDDLPSDQAQLETKSLWEESQRIVQALRGTDVVFAVVGVSITVYPFPDDGETLFLMRLSPFAHIFWPLIEVPRIDRRLREFGRKLIAGIVREALALDLSSGAIPWEPRSRRVSR